MYGDTKVTSARGEGETMSRTSSGAARPAQWLLPLVLACLLTPGCDAGRVVDQYVASGPGDVDMLWVLDNSASMHDAQLLMRDSFGAFVAGLPDDTATRIAITSTQAWPCTEDISSEGCNDRKGSTGRVIHRDGEPAFLDPTDPVDQAAFLDLADVGIHGAGYERGLQVALLAACEAVDLPEASDFVPGVDDLKWDFPVGCSGDNWDPTHPLYEACHCLPKQVEMEIDGHLTTVGLHGANEGLLRGDALHVVIVTDEGDTSGNIVSLKEEECGGPPDVVCRCMHSTLLRLLYTVHDNVQISVIGPGQGPAADESTRYQCNPLMNDECLLDFHFWSVEETGGTFVPILVPGVDYDPDEVPDVCHGSGFAEAMAELVLVHPTQEWYALSHFPDSETIRVRVNGSKVPAEEEDGACTDAEFGGGGWRYDPHRRAVILLGDCTAFPPDTVKITYEPMVVIYP